MAGSIKDLSRYRYERSSEELENAKAMLKPVNISLLLTDPIILFFTVCAQ